MSQVTVTRLSDGPRNAVYHVAIVGDGVGDEINATLIDPTEFVPPGAAVPQLRLDRLWYDLTGFDAWLEFDFLASDTAIWSMTGGSASTLDFTALGGLADRSAALDGSGKLLLSTSGLGLNDRGTIVVWARKG